MASYEDESEEDDKIDEPVAIENKTRDTMGDGTLSHEETWRINLGRDDNNKWLTAPRDADEWFTGKQPKKNVPALMLKESSARCPYRDSMR
jgi:hypothetical protein